MSRKHPCYTTAMVLYSTTHRVGDYVTTAQIIAPAQRADDPATLAAFCLAAVDATLADRVRDGDLLLAGHGFGAGDDPETAVLALQALGFAAVVCASADSAFVAAAHASGLPVLVAPDAVTLEPGGGVRLDLARGTITERASGAVYRAATCPPEVIAAVQRAQLLNRMRRVVEDEGYDG